MLCCCSRPIRSRRASRAAGMSATGTTYQRGAPRETGGGSKPPRPMGGPLPRAGGGRRRGARARDVLLHPERPRVHPERLARFSLNSYRRASMGSSRLAFRADKSRTRFPRGREPNASQMALGLHRHRPPAKRATPRWIRSQARSPRRRPDREETASTRTARGCLRPFCSDRHANTISAFISSPRRHDVMIPMPPRGTTRRDRPEERAHRAALALGLAAAFRLRTDHEVVVRPVAC